MSTALTVNVTDTDSQTWNNGTFRIRFVPAPNAPGGPYSWTGGAFDPNNVYTGSLSSSGVLTQTLPANTEISPSGSQWNIEVVSATNPTSSYESVQLLTAGSQTVNLTPPGPRIPPGSGNVVYNTTEVSGPQMGSQIYVIGTGLQVYSGTAWAATGGGGVGYQSGQFSGTLQTTDTSPHTLINAQVGKHTAINALTITNETATATVVSLGDGTVTYKFALAANGGVQMLTPLPGTSVNTAWTVTSSQTVTLDFVVNYQLF